MADLKLVVNYALPPAGFTRACPIQATFTAVPFNIDFKTLEGSNLADTPFRPTGVYIDNTQSTNALTVMINELNYRIICPAGASINLPYPAPAYSTASITGNGPASLIFVDYPVKPYSSATGGGGSVAATWGSITGTLSAQTDLQSALNAKVTNPMLAVGDLIVGGTAGTPLELTIGSTGQVLKVAGGTAAWSTLSKADVGLSNVDNTSDVNKTVSTAQAAAIAAKANVMGPWTTLPLSAGFTAFAGQTPAYRYNNDRCEFRGRVTSTNAITAGSATPFATLAAVVGLVPPFTQQQVTHLTSTDTVATFLAMTSGVLAVLSWGGLAPAAAFDLNGNFFIITP